MKYLIRMVKNSTHLIHKSLQPSTLWLILGAIFLVAVSFTYITLSQKAASRLAPASVPVATKSVSPRNWNVYAGNFFTINYPDTLQYVFDDGSHAPVALLRNVPTILFSSKNTPRDKHNVELVMVRIFNKNSVPIDTAARSYFGKLSPTWRDIEIGSYKGKVTTALDYNSDKQIGLVAILTVSDNIYYFHLYQPTLEQNIYQQDFYQMLKTFKTTH